MPPWYHFRAMEYRTLRWPGEILAQAFPAAGDDRAGWVNTPSIYRLNTQPGDIPAILLTRPWKDLGHPLRTYAEHDLRNGVSPFGWNLDVWA